MGSLLITIIFLAILKNVVAASSNAAFRITGGQKTKSGEFPYLAGIVSTDHKKAISVCAGSLISITSVLTAAHCLHEKVSSKITLGAIDISGHSTEKMIQTFNNNINSTKYIIHPEYKNGTLNHDVAIIKLSHPAKLNSHVKIIPIPTDDKETYVGKSGIVMGWGKTSQTAVGAYLTALYHTDNVIISNTDCQNALPVFKSQVKDTHICQSGEGGKSTCDGDSGGPLVVDGVVVGVLTFEYKTCEAGYPAVFTRLSKYIHWIKENSVQKK